MSCRNKTRVATEVILQRMGQLAAERRRDEGRPPVRDAWAPVLAEPVTGLHDIRLQCEEDDPQYVWRLETMLENERKSVKLLKTMLENEDATIGKQNGDIESLEEENESLQEENERLQDDNERLRDASAVAKENERLRVGLLLAAGENERLRAELLLAAKAAAKVAKLVEGLEVALSCPLSLGRMEDPVVSKYGHTYEREFIEKALNKKSKCPMTNQRLTKEHMPINRALVDVANAFNAYQAPAAAPPPQ